MGNIDSQSNKDQNIPMESKAPIEKYNNNQLIISNYDSGVSIVTKEVEWNIVEEGRIDSQSNRNKNVEKKSKVVLMILRVPIKNKTPIT